MKSLHSIQLILNLRDSALAISFVGFVRGKDCKILWLWAVFSVNYCIWMERTARIFRDQAVLKQQLWDTIMFVVSLWSNASPLLGVFLYLICSGIWVLLFLEHFKFSIFSLLRICYSPRGCCIFLAS